MNIRNSTFAETWLTSLTAILCSAILVGCQGQGNDPYDTSTNPSESMDQPTDDSQASGEIEPQTANTQDATMQPEDTTEITKPANTLETATLGAGCYWCIEAVLEQVDGVHDIVSGFMGGPNPKVTYREVCTGTTGHAEVVQVTFDPEVLAYEELLDWFWRLHDPTTLNRQGADVGTQYRSVIFYHSDAQKDAAEESLQAADATGAFADPIVTEISPVSEFILGPKDHQEYYSNNRRAGYCRAVIAPKLKKLGLKE